MNWTDECKKEAAELSRETRQKFLDLMWSGKSIGEAMEIVGISFNAANGIMMENITKVMVLNTKAK